MQYLTKPVDEMASYNPGMVDSGGARFMFWLTVLVGVPFFIWQMYCWLNGMTVPALGRAIGAGPLEQSVGGVVSPEAHARIGWFLLAEGILFFVIGLFAYMNSYYRGR